MQLTPLLLLYAVVTGLFAVALLIVPSQLMSVYGAGGDRARAYDIERALGSCRCPGGTVGGVQCAGVGAGGALHPIHGVLRHRRSREHVTEGWRVLGRCEPPNKRLKL